MVINTNTTLPNGDKWHKDYDMTIFTNPEHPSDFYEPEWVKEERERKENEHGL